MPMYVSMHRYKPQTSSGLLTRYDATSAVCSLKVSATAIHLSHAPQASSSGAVFEEEDFPRVVKPQQSHCISNMQTVCHSLSQSSLMIQHLPGVVR